MAEPRTCLEEAWCTTQVEAIPLSFTWKIKNFSLIIKQIGDEISSHQFSSEFVSTDIKWHLTVLLQEIMPLVQSQSPLPTVLVQSPFLLPTILPLQLQSQSQSLLPPVKINYISVRLCSSSKRKADVETKYNLSILSNENKKTNTVSQPNLMKFNTTYHTERFITQRELRANASSLLPNDTLTLVCEITVLEKVSRSGKVEIIKIPESNLLRDFEELLKNPLHSDVKLVVDGEEFNVHKGILAARSRVFAAMFSHNMAESDTNVVEIVDVKKDALREILRFIYTGKTGNLNTIAQEVLAAADKYDLESLKVTCGIALADTLSIDNAANILILADLHNSSKLKTKAMDFVRRNFDAVMKTPGWNTLVRNHSLLLNEVTILFSQFSV